MQSWRVVPSGIDSGWQWMGHEESHSVMVLAFPLSSPHGELEFDYDLSQSSPLASLRIYVDEELTAIYSAAEAPRGLAQVPISANSLSPTPFLRNITLDFYQPAIVRPCYALTLISLPPLTLYS